MRSLSRLDHCATSVVFTYPAGAAITVTGRSIATSRLAIKRSRSTHPLRTRGAKPLLEKGVDDGSPQALLGNDPGCPSPRPRSLLNVRRKHRFTERQPICCRTLGRAKLLDRWFGAPSVNSLCPARSADGVPAPLAPAGGRGDRLAGVHDGGRGSVHPIVHLRICLTVAGG